MKSVVKAMARPVHLVADGIHRVLPHNKKHSKLVIGGAMMLTGATLASIHQGYIPHVLWDAFSWLLHGIGAAPIINLFTGE